MDLLDLRWKWTMQSYVDGQGLNMRQNKSMCSVVYKNGHLQNNGDDNNEGCG